MKILFGVQGTGNGHITRARAMAAALRLRQVDVDYLFSGRPRSGYFDMGIFGSYRSLTGLTFVSKSGRLSYTRTAIGNHYWQFFQDVLGLDLASYDIIVTDFEPVTAWAGKLQCKTVISIGHQPAFYFAIPQAGHDLWSRWVMRLFAPGSVRVGLHWASFGAPLLPPMIESESLGVARQIRGKILVYLPFEDLSQVRSLLAPFLAHDFYVYASGVERCDSGNIHIRPTSLDGFREDLVSSQGVICNAGFELASECLSLGKRLLVKPQGRQMEQISNALALAQLGYGSVMPTLDSRMLGSWLDSGDVAPQLSYPDVAGALSDWLLAGDYSEPALRAMSAELWARVLDNSVEAVGTGAGARESPSFASQSTRLSDSARNAAISAITSSSQSTARVP